MRSRFSRRTPTGLSRLALSVFCVLLGLIWGQGEANATTLRYQSARDLAEHADAVVWASVTRVGTRMQRSASGLQPEREAWLAVRELLAGDAPRSLAVQLRGGTHPGGERRVEGEARLREGEEVVLFLTRRGGVWRVLGMSLGVWRIQDGAAPDPRVVRRVEDAVVLDDEGQALPPVDESLSMTALRAMLRRSRRSP